jgi:hypothetical protein
MNDDTQTPNEVFMAGYHAALSVLQPETIGEYNDAISQLRHTTKELLDRSFDTKGTIQHSNFYEALDDAVKQEEQAIRDTEDQQRKQNATKGEKTTYVINDAALPYSALSNISSDPEKLANVYLDAQKKLPTIDLMSGEQPNILQKYLQNRQPNTK